MSNVSARMLELLESDAGFWDRLDKIVRFQWMRGKAAETQAADLFKSTSDYTAWVKTFVRLREEMARAGYGKKYASLTHPQQEHVTLAMTLGKDRFDAILKDPKSLENVFSEYPLDLGLPLEDLTPDWFEWAFGDEVEYRFRAKTTR